MQGSEVAFRDPARPHRDHHGHGTELVCAAGVAALTGPVGPVETHVIVTLMVQPHLI